MFLRWRVRYLDSRDKQFKDRDLWLVSEDLDPATRAAVELVSSSEGRQGRERDIIRFRYLFHAGKPLASNSNELLERYGKLCVFCVPEYFEDENGKELTPMEMGFILTGDANAIMFPGWMKPYDIEYVLANCREIQIAEITIPKESLVVLGYFVRDLRRMLASSFLSEGPGILSGGANGVTFATAITDEELCAFAAIFRRLYGSDRASFLNAVAKFRQCVGEHPLTKWITEIRREYVAALGNVPCVEPFDDQKNWSFTGKDLIDAYLYTQYLHQPNSDREQLYQTCLSAVGGNRSKLTWLFLNQIWACAALMHNAGVAIAGVYDRYCEHHGVSPEILVSLVDEHPGIGALEKKDAQRERRIREKANEVAESLWRESGRPPGGPQPFVPQAMRHLNALLGESRNEVEPNS